jgi:membrane protease YdiL (CAAX protease family)
MLFINTQTVDFSWGNQTIQSFFPILLATLAFITYWFIAQSPRIKNFYYYKYTFDQASYRHIIFTKAIGFSVMGILPLGLSLIVLKPFPKHGYGLKLIPETSLFSMIWIIGLCILVIPLVYFSAKKAKNLVNYPQIRSKYWNKKMFYMNAFGWFIYLFGYELLFRGILLFPLVDSLGVWPAIAINIALYSATHIPKGLDETIGALPLGLVLCILTLYSGTIWIAFFVHVAMAWTNSFTALKHHPDIHYTRNNRK